MLLGASLRPDEALFSPDPSEPDDARSVVSASSNSARPGPRHQAEELIALARAVGRADLDLLLVGDRHAAPGNSFAPVPLITRLLPEVRRVPVGCVFLAPFHHPVVLAEQLGTIAAFTDAPFTAAFAIGDTEAQFAAFGMALKSRTVRTDEVIEIVRRLLIGEEVSFDGRYHRLEKVRIGPLPERPIGLWVGGRRGAAVERAGRLGDAWVTDTGTPDNELAVELARYRSTADAHARPSFAVLRRHLVMGDSDAEANRSVAAVVATARRAVAAEDILSGSPSTVVEKLLTYEAAGFAMTVVSHVSADHARTLASIEMLGESVLPALRLAARSSVSAAENQARLED